MGSVQTSYDRYTATAYPGLVADNNPSERISKIAEGDIDFGLAVQRGTSDDQAKIGSGASAVGFLGVACRMLNQEGALADASLKYNDEDMVAILKSGWIYLKITNTGAAGLQLNMNNTTGVIKAGAAGAGESEIPGGRLEETVSVANTVALCRISSESAAVGGP